MCDMNAVCLLATFRSTVECVAPLIKYKNAALDILNGHIVRRWLLNCRRPQNCKCPENCNCPIATVAIVIALISIPAV